MLNRILIVGLGTSGKRHLAIARATYPTADIRVFRHQVTSEVPEHSNGCFSGADEVIAFAPQVAIIASPAPYHIAVAHNLAAAGVHLLIEKPLSTSLEGIAELIDLCRKQGTVLQVGFNLRFLDVVQRFRELLSEGFIGKVLSIRCEVGQYLPLWRPSIDYRRSVSARHVMGGGVLLELSHDLDLLRWIFGEFDWVNATLSRQSDLEIDVEDTTHLTFGIGTAIHGHQLMGNISLDFIRHDKTRLYTAIGINGTLRLNVFSGVIEYFAPDAEDWLEIFRTQGHIKDSFMTQ